TIRHPPGEITVGQASRDGATRLQPVAYQALESAATDATVLRYRKPQRPSTADRRPPTAD
ncbi:MAG: hypothetical protein M3Z04_18200, partial [Chloroflexota bacterium]|nr:hypothetical protein [Chloroflexota bacterium]